MTLITAIKYNHGMVLASDSRVIAGDLSLKKDQARKLVAITDKIGVAGAGLTGAMDDIINAAKIEKLTKNESFEDIVELFSKLNNTWLKYNQDRLEKDQTGPTFILVNSARIRRIFSRGYSEEAYNYACEGSGRLYGEYILRSYYREEMEKKDAIQLAIFIISEVSKMDPAVGLPISMIILPEKGKHEEVKEEEIQKVIDQIVPRNLLFGGRILSLAESITERRANINLLFKSKFGFELFLQNERSILNIMKTCQTEQDFIHHIQALALLIEQMDIKQLTIDLGNNKGLGSIGLLSKFLTVKGINANGDLIPTFKAIHKLRSASFPVHNPDTELVALIYDWTKKFPPNWAELWYISLKKFETALEGLEKCTS